jgi:pimeloyl-ACP methyl ester carboxylesterase
MSAKEPLVLLHGFSGSTVMWDPVLEPLSEHHELHVWALAGHAGGELLADGIEYSVATLADDLEARMDAAGIETAHVCGNSLGGWLALELGVRGRARSVVAIAPAGGWEAGSREERRLRRYFARQYRLVRFGGPRADRIVRSARMRRLTLRDACVRGDLLTAEQAAAIVRGAYDCSVWRELVDGIESHGPPVAFDGIEVPVRLIWGTRDRILPHRRYTQRLRTMLPDADYVELAGVGHVPMIDDPAAVSAAILEVTARERVPA